MVPVLVLAVPIFDTTLVIISRLRRGSEPADHARQGSPEPPPGALTGSTREAVLICYLLGFAAGVMATFVTQASVLEGYAVGGSCRRWPACLASGGWSEHSTHAARCKR